ncbi:MAG: hypothetical protein KBT21_04685 [Treponema sp.]|nr:hypothetical protein [Candidatus Treponema merdequi]
MKKLSLIVGIVFFSLTSVFGVDYRQILFGNNYKNIIRIEDQNKVKMHVAQVKSVIENSIYTWEYEFYAFEETYSNGTVIRIVGLRAFDKFGDRITDSKIEEIVNLEALYPRELIQVVYVNAAGGPCVIFNHDFTEKIMADGTVRSSIGFIYRGLEVVSRNGKIIGFCSHETKDRTTYYTPMDDETMESVRETEYEKNSIAYFSSCESVYKCNQKQLDLECKYDFFIEAPFALIDSERPFRYTIQNMFDNNHGTCFVEKIGDKEHDSYRLYCGGSDKKLKQIKMINGLAYDKKNYSENNRVKTIKEVENSNNSISLKDNILAPQVFDWKDFSFKIDDKYKGSKYDDTCIAELDFLINDGKDRWLFGN